jgi:hypothetical protein
MLVMELEAVSILLKIYALRAQYWKASQRRAEIERDGILFVMEGEKKKRAAEEVKRWLKKLSLIP